MPAQARINGVRNVPTAPIGRPDVLWGLPGQGGLLTEWAESVPDLVWPESIRTYGRMRRDPKIQAVLNAFFLPIMRTNWMVDPAGVTKAKAVDLLAGDLGLPVLGEKGPPPAQAGIPGFHWGEHLRLALLANVYGFFPFERWYAPKTAKDGLTHVAGIDERMPHTVAMIDLDDNGQVRSVLQNTQNEPLPANRMLWYVHEREGGNWAGVSMLRSAYTPWILKHEVQRVHATSIRRWGMGIPVVKAPPGGTPAQIAEAQRLASGMRAGDTAGAGLPDGYTFDISGVTGSLPDAMGFLNFLNQEIASAALAVFLELGLSSGGARALGDTFVDMFLLSLQAAADAIGDTITYGAPSMPGLSRALTDINFGPGEPCPRIIAADVGDRHEVTATAIQALVACGAVQPDDALEAFIREAWDFPARTAPRTPPPPPKGAPGAPGSGGPPTPPGTPNGPGSGTPPGPAGPPPNPQPVSKQPNMYAPPSGPPGRRGGQPAISSADDDDQPGWHVAAAGGALRRPLTELEAAAGLDPEAMRAELETATDRVLSQWHPILTAQRQDLADQVTAAVDDGRLDKLAAMQPPTGYAADVLYRAMSQVAATAAGRAVAEAAGQGVTIDLADVHVDHDRLRQLAKARALIAGQHLAAAAGRKALQVVTASAGTDAAREVTAVLHGLSPRSLADQLLAALHSAANEARFAVLAAAPGAVYTATELADDPNCCQPCQDVDGHEFADLADARAAYANGAYTQCLGGLRCRGTVVATWPHTPFHLGVPGTAEPWPHHLTPPPDLTGDQDVAAKFNPAQRRGRDGKWISEGGGTAGRAEHGLAKVAALTPRGTVAPITAAEARGDSRPVTMAEFQRLAAEGRDQIARLRANATPPKGLDEHWDKILADTWAETRKSWGGATIDAHTGQALPQGADKYALTVKPADMASVSVPETASEQAFRAAMNTARAKFATELSAQQAYLGIFHDDDLHRVDIDPVLVVDTRHEVDTVGAFTHAIGGAYKFSDGNGYWPPHVADVPAQVAAKDGEPGEPVHFDGPGQWRTQADEPRRDALRRLHEDSDAEDTQDEPGPQAAFNPDEARGPHGEWVHGPGGEARKTARQATPGTRPELSGYELWSSPEGHVDHLTPAEAQSAHRIWYSTNALDTNAWLRDGKDYLGHPPPAQFAGDAATFAHLIDRSPGFTQPATMWRGTYLGAKLFGPPGTAAGKTFTDKGLVSLSASEEVVHSYGDTLIRVHVPAGTHALRGDDTIWQPAPNAPDRTPGDVQEYTLAPGHAFHVTSDSPYHSMFGGNRILDVELLPATTPGQQHAAAAAAAAVHHGDLPGGAARFAWHPGDVQFTSPTRAAGEPADAQLTIHVTLTPGSELPGWHQPGHPTLASAHAEVERLRAWSPPGPGSAIREVVVSPKGDAAQAAASTQAAWHFNPFQRRGHHGEWTGDNTPPPPPHEPTADEARALSDDELAAAPGTPAAGERRRRADHSGNYVQLWHGTSRDNARSISRDGMHGTYSQDDPTLSPERIQARLLPYELNPALHWPDNPAAVLDVRVPAEKEAEYLFPPRNDLGFRALRKPLPPEMVYGHKLEPYNDPIAVDAAGFDPAKHLRKGPGRGGGEFTRTPGSPPATPAHQTTADPRAMLQTLTRGQVEIEPGTSAEALRTITGGLDKVPASLRPGIRRHTSRVVITSDVDRYTGHKTPPGYTTLGMYRGTTRELIISSRKAADSAEAAVHEALHAYDRGHLVSGSWEFSDVYREAEAARAAKPSLVSPFYAKRSEEWAELGARYLTGRKMVLDDERGRGQLPAAVTDTARAYYRNLFAGPASPAARAAAEPPADGCVAILTPDGQITYEEDTTPPGPAAARGEFDPDKHPRGYHGRFGHGTGPARKTRTPGTGRRGDLGKGHEGYPGQFRERLTGHWRTETDDEAKQHLNLAGAAYDNNQYDQAADELRHAAGRVGPLGRAHDRDVYNNLADAIEQHGQDLGVSHAAQLLTAIGTEIDATNYGTVADQLSSARRVIDRAQPGTNWRTQAGEYLQAAADRAYGHDDFAAGRRYQMLYERVMHLPDVEAPGHAELDALVARAAPGVPKLLGGGRQRWNGQLGTFTKDEQPDFLGFTYPDGHIEFRADVVNGLLDAQAHPDRQMAEPDNLDVVLHELIHDTTGGGAPRTPADEREWQALSGPDRLVLGNISDLDKHSASGGTTPIYRTFGDLRETMTYLSPEDLDDFTRRGLLEKSPSTTSTTNSLGQTMQLGHSWRLTAKARRLIPGSDDTTRLDSDAYTSVTGHDIEEGFTELGATEHMERFAKDQGFGQVLTTRISTVPIRKPPAIKQIYQAQDELRAITDAAGKVGAPGTINGPGSLQAYQALLNARDQISAPDLDRAKFAGFLVEARDHETDPQVRGRIAGLVTKLGIAGGGTIDNPAWAKAKQDLLKALRAEQAKLEQDGRPPQAQAARHLGVVIGDVQNDMPADEVGDVLTEVQHLGSMAAEVKALRGKLDTFTATPVLKHDTVPEYARHLADPEKIRTGEAGQGAWDQGQWHGSWGHYPILTATAQEWVQRVARSEGKTGFNKVGTAGYRRTVELADEINREGTAGKITAMARQVLRNQGIDPDTADPSVLASVREEIIATYGDPSADGHGAGAAYKAARRAAKLASQGYQRQGGTMVKFGAAPAGDDDDDDDGGVLPVTVTLTGAGAEAEQIRGRAWQDPATLDRAAAQIRALAEQTTDPAALRQVQDAGRSLRMLALRRRTAGTDPRAAGAGWRPDLHPRDGHGRWTHAPGGGTHAPRPARTASPEPSPVTAEAQQAAAALDKAIRSGGEQDHIPGENLAAGDDIRSYYGTTADTAIVSYADGSTWVRKRGLPEEGVNHEVAYSRLARALGIPAPVAIKRAGPDGKPEMYEPKVDGIPAIEWTGGTDPEEGDDPGPGRDPAQLYNSPEGRMIGLADQMAGTAERHPGNWLVTHDAAGDHPVPIDNNDAIFPPWFGSITEFADFPMPQLAAEHPPAEWDRWHANLDGLHDEFTTAGMAGEWANLMSNFAEAKRQAGVT